MNNVKILTIESDFGAGIKGAKHGPSKLLSILKNTNHFLAKLPVETVGSDNIEEDNKFVFAKNINSVLEIQMEAVTKIQQILSDNSFPLVISGDHSNGMAAISAIKDLYQDKTIGVIWVDAHADLHSPFTTPSGNMHGMPLAACLGVENLNEGHNKPSKKEIEFWQKLERLGSNKITPKILPENLVIIELRDFEEEEISLINQLNIKYYTPKDRENIGVKTIAQQTLDYLKHCDYILVSFDVDSLDPSISHGTGTPVVNGLSVNQAVELLSAFKNSEKLIAFEMTEINPLLDRNNPMEEVACKILTSVF